jgi:hypothetical protein
VSRPLPKGTVSTGSAPPPELADRFSAAYEAALKSAVEPADRPPQPSHGRYIISVRATDLDGQPLEGAEITFTELPGGFTYREYWTGPGPWWKRAWRTIRWFGW